jgi:hypothetical protein
LIGVALFGCWTMRADDIKPFDAKPGLWETTNTTEITGMPVMPQIPPEALAKMTPEQRAQFDAMMKGRGAAGGPRSTTTKSCLTREALERGLAFHQSDKSCAPKVVSSSSSKQVMHVECDQGKVKTTGDLTIERIDSEHAKGTMTMKSTEANQPINVKMSFTTKWLSSDCGDVKPMGEK